MIVVDLFCGMGGWTNGFLACGFDVVGVDVVAFPEYRGKLLLRDVRELRPDDLPRGTMLIVASPPCEEYSRHDMPWTRRRNPPPPDLSLWQAAVSLARGLGVPHIVENVRGAQRWWGKARAHVGPYYLWGDGVPVEVLRGVKTSARKKKSYSSRDRARRALIPPELSDAVASYYARVAEGAA